MSDGSALSSEAYADALSEYSQTHTESALYRASLLSRAFIERGLGPEEIVALHGQAFARACEGRPDRERLRLSADSVEFLLEVMIAYGVQHAEYLELKAREREHEAETRTARREADLAQRLQLLSDAALAHLGPDRLLEELLTRVRDILAADTVVVLVPTEDMQQLVLRAEIGLTRAESAKVPIPIGQGFAGRVARSAGPVIVDNSDAQEFVSPGLRTRGVRSLLGTRMVVEGRLAGVLHVGTLTPRHFTLDEGHVLQLVADRLALALDRADLYEQVVRHEAQLRLLVARLMSTQEEERRRLAYDVHDGLAQLAAGAYQHLQAFADDYPPRSATGRGELGRALDLSRGTVREARRVIAGLRPTALDDLGLSAALRVEVDTLRDANWQATFEEELGSERLPPMLETALFRTAQEALNNVRKHAQSTRVHIRLRRVDGRVQLEVRDWGVGFPAAANQRPANPGEQVGLSSMHERIALVGGAFYVESRPGEGTRVLVDVPLAQQWPIEAS